MAIARHSPQNCALVSHEVRGQALQIIQRMDDVAEAHGCRLEGAWGNLVAHTTFFLVDAPNAHTLEDMLVELGVIGLNSVEIYPVRPQAEVFEYLATPPTKTKT